MTLAVGLMMSMSVVSAVEGSGGGGGGPSDGFLTEDPPYIDLEADVPGDVTAIISSGDKLGDFTFEGIPDGVGITAGERHGTLDVYVAHEQSTVPFRDQADFQDASVSKLTLSKRDASVLDASVAISPDEGYIRFCSAFMATHKDGFRHPTFFVGEESNDIIDVPAGAAYGPDPGIAPQRQAGYVVAYDTVTETATPIPGMGRLNHENNIVVPGGWRKTAILTTDDTFSGPSAQLYMYLAGNDKKVIKDKGHLWAFQVTHKNGERVKRKDPFNDANDYLDIRPGDDMRGRFIRVPDAIADGTTADAPQDALENWSNENNVFQFIRLEDLATDKHNKRVVYIADTGRTRVVPDPETGRLMRGDSGTTGQADFGSMFRMEFNKYNPKRVDSFTVLAQGDDEFGDAYVPFVSPDNVGTSAKSLMVQEDAANARIWRYDLWSGDWSVVATVNDDEGESSGIVDASKWFGSGAWLVTVQAHGSNDEAEMVDGVTLKREDGQLLLVRMPGT
jgi:hypothetical protein